MKNNFDNIELNLTDVKKKIENITFEEKRTLFPNFFKKYFVGALIYFGIYKKLINSSIISAWFDEFEFFWTKVLGGRPLYFHDFHFLLGVYRQKFQSLYVEEKSSPEKFLNAWQNPKNLYLLFGAVRKYSLEPFGFYKVEKYLKNNDNFLEYGCGIAPLTKSLMTYSSKKLNYYYADIIQINTLYANYRLKNKAKFFELKPGVYNYDFNTHFNVITLITVLEHLTDPVACVQYLHSILNNNGYLIFDFILSKGEGLDTIEALEQREKVIDFVEKNFEIITGKLYSDRSVGITVVKKK